VSARLETPLSHAVTALVLMALEAEPGRWLTLPHLVADVWASEDVLRNHLEPLAQAGSVELRRCRQGLIEAARTPGDEGALPHAGLLPQLGTCASALGGVPIASPADLSVRLDPAYLV
jgi:hypothetical protein